MEKRRKQVMIHFMAIGLDSQQYIHFYAAAIAGNNVFNKRV